MSWKSVTSKNERKADYAAVLKMAAAELLSLPGTGLKVTCLMEANALGAGQHMLKGYVLARISGQRSYNNLGEFTVNLTTGERKHKVVL